MRGTLCVRFGNGKTKKPQLQFQKLKYNQFPLLFLCFQVDEQLDVRRGKGLNTFQKIVSISRCVWKCSKFYLCSFFSLSWNNCNTIWHQKKRRKRSYLIKYTLRNGAKESLVFVLVSICGMEQRMNESRNCNFACCLDSPLIERRFSWTIQNKTEDIINRFLRCCSDFQP